MRWTKKDSLDLEGLAMPKCFSDPEALARIGHFDMAYVRDKFAAARPHYDVDMRDINDCIYRGCLISSMGLDMVSVRRKQLERMKSLFGFPDDDACYAWIDSHICAGFDVDAGERLVSDALVTGRWEELPDELQAVYHVRKKDLP